MENVNAYVVVQRATFCLISVSFIAMTVSLSYSDFTISIMLDMVFRIIGWRGSTNIAQLASILVVVLV